MFNNIVRFQVGVLLGLALAGCSNMQSSATIDAVPSTTPFITLVASTPTPVPFPTSTSTPVPIVNPLNEFPLTVGSYWVYTHTEYIDESVSSFCCITRTVISNDMQPPYFLAKIRLERAVVTGTPPANFKPLTWYYWYVIQDTGEVYALGDPLELSAIQTATLEYVFPIVQGSCWFRDPSQTAGTNCTWADGPIEKATPAGIFSNCYWIVTPFLSGGTQEWFCYGVGYVGDKYDHNGSKYGDETSLVTYQINPP